MSFTSIEINELNELKNKRKFHENEIKIIIEKCKIIRKNELKRRKEEREKSQKERNEIKEYSELFFFEFIFEENAIDDFEIDISFFCEKNTKFNYIISGNSKINAIELIKFLAKGYGKTVATGIVLGYKFNINEISNILGITKQYVYQILRRIRTLIYEKDFRDKFGIEITYK